MESLIVHPKNQMELNALKGVLKDMGIQFEKFHTRTVVGKKKDTTPKPKDLKENAGKTRKPAAD